ncbi:hypothetical protein BD410DRAFT_790397 [Rickenella mellea]|uniref:F-box domain-containing protein n=1 Tax=Rickenella mellea TaxID=50990 RepID=A0A4Y7Q1L3_9AGAM|nr:hypothetical protein BD410DRAFT_790397 [Rickenella mellea]
MDGLNLVEKLISIIRSKGWDDAFTEDVLCGVPRSRSELDALSDDESPTSSLQLLKDSKYCMATLGKVTDRLGRKIRRLEKRTMPGVLEEGIRRLPDELLANIFELGHLSTDDGEYALQGVSHVSRRFRSVSLQTPIVWTRLSVIYPNAEIQAFVSRSGQLDLEIDTFHLSSSKLEAVLKILGVYSHRWSHLHLFDPAVEPAMERLGLTTFPRLNYLYHSCSVELFTWAMPLLSHIECHCWYFRPGATFAAQVTKFEISFEDMDVVDIGGLSEALQSMTNLQDLSVQLADCRSVEYETDSNSLKPHSIQIDKLTISMNEGTLLEVAQGLYDVLSFLTATTVDISLDNVVKGPQFDYLKTADGDFFPFGTVIVLRISRWIYMPSLFSAIGQYCNIAHTVRFDIPLGRHFTDGIHDEIVCTPFPSIRHIEFHNCDSLYEEQVQFMVKHPLFAQVENFNLVSCHHVSEDFLLDLRNEIGERVKWAA